MPLAPKLPPRPMPHLVIVGIIPEHRRDVLYVRAQIVNTSNVDQNVPPVQITAYDGAGKIVQSKTFWPPFQRLAPHAAWPFRASLGVGVHAEGRFTVGFVPA